MPSFCDVAVPVPLDAVFTYRTGETQPVVGGRVLVPFRTERMVGIVTALHDNEPKIKTKSVIAVLDAEPVLDAALRKLGEWISQYYLAPIGEVFRTMLPLSAEVKRSIVFRVAEKGYEALAASAEVGSSLRSRRTPSEQMAEYAVLDYLAQRESATESSLRSATKASKAVLTGLLRKKWIVREDASTVRDARRLVDVAVLVSSRGKSTASAVRPGAPVDTASAREGRKLTEKQQRIIVALHEDEGRATLDILRELGHSRATLLTLVKRGLVQIVQEPAGFAVSTMAPKGAGSIALNDVQQKALAQVRSSFSAKKFSVSLLHGVTGSGKTAIYLAAMKEVLAAGKAAIMLVPEIGLTPAAAAHLHEIFGDEVAILHSALTPDERAEQWHRIQRGEARAVVGTRSAVFAPVAAEQLALIVVDEEHDSSYKQEETPRYHGRDVAVMRGKLSSAAVVLGSATPSLESYYNSQQGKYALIELRDRVEQRPLPVVEVLDMRAEFAGSPRKGEPGEQAADGQIFSRKLLEEIGERLERKEQVMVLLNRRGYAPVVLCRACGESVQCQNCAIALTLHKRERKLECHYCGFKRAVPQTCPKCGSEYVQFIGTGTEKLEDRLHAAFPQARIGRMDRDTVRGKDDFESMLSALDSGELDLLVGTQMIAKGHDVHGVTLVGVVGADFALGFPDFRAAERTFQLLTQVAGRAGRGESPGKVVMQTFAPEHYAIQYAAQHDYAGFYEKELRFRRWMHYPPFTAIANVLVRSDDLDDTLNWSGQLGKWFERNKQAGVRVMGPAVAPLSRLKSEHRYHFVVKAETRNKLNAQLTAMLRFAGEQKIPRTNLIVDVDAVNLL